MKLIRPNSFILILPFIIFLVERIEHLFAGAQGSNSYTTQEKDAIKKLRSQVDDKLTLEYMKKDGYLLRWLRSYEFDISKAHQELEKTLKWRKEHNMDTILDGDISVNERDLPYNVDKFDREGRPLLVIHLGKWAVRKYIVQGKRAEVAKEFNRMNERAVRKVFETADRTGKDIDQYYFLFQLQGYNRRDHLCAGCVPIQLELALGFDSGVAPFVSNITVINAPRYFQPVLALVKQLLGRLALKTMTDFDSDKSQWLPVILKDIAPDQLTNII